MCVLNTPCSFEAPSVLVRTVSLALVLHKSQAHPLPCSTSSLGRVHPVALPDFRLQTHLSSHTPVCSTSQLSFLPFAALRCPHWYQHWHHPLGSHAHPCGLMHSPHSTSSHGWPALSRYASSLRQSTCFLISWSHGRDDWGRVI